MIHRINLSLTPEAASDAREIARHMAEAIHSQESDINVIRILRRSVDARKPRVVINIEAEVFTCNDHPEERAAPFKARNVTGGKEVIIAGSGPAGLFAALRLIELGIRPVIVERGNEISERKRDIAQISRQHTVNPDSNYCFGEGGAGTFSDGKLYTRSKKRGDNSRVMELFHLFGADADILYEAHPHIGTDKLPGIVKNIRETIIECGGVFLFNKRITGLMISHREIKGVVTGNEKFPSDHVILATGHSAGDVYHLLHHQKIALQMKPFAMGVRAEHPQVLIDRIQYHGRSRGSWLPPASYTLARQVGNRGVYSFCMCPGGFIVPSATSDGEVVVNGMSASRRNSPWANSGIVTEIKPEDLTGFSAYGPLAGLQFREDIERLAWEAGGRRQTAPAQRLTDFIDGRASSSLPRCSYSPGITASSLHEWLPEPVESALKEGFRAFGRIMKGYLTDEAIIVGVESRSSSPVRIPRDPSTLEHIEVKGLFPCGEGSGYAGGIISSAIDGIRAAEQISLRLGL
ncbi:MAG: FAD-dependent monooxygenase [Bacteroidales bacterium]|jgi:uncharacterized FAD-dependent dehydrogenase|nr:FAD-dependent monooxygenase [Bacteroidales bacterium]